MDAASVGASKKYADKLNPGFGFNLGPGLLDYRIGLAEKAAATPTKILCLGDSITRGQFTSNEPETSWASVLRKSLQAKYGNAGVGWINALEGVFPAGTQPRVSLGAGWIQAAGTKSGFGGGYISSNGVTTAATFNFTGDKFTIVYARGSVGGNADVRIDGTSVGTLNCNNATTSFNNYQAFTGLTNAAHVLTIVPATSAQIMIEGIIAEISTAGIQVWKNGMAGYTSIDWNNTNTKSAWAGRPCHLTIIALGVNDGGLGTGLAAYKTNMDAMVQHFLGLGSSVLLLPLMRGGSAWTTAWPDFVQANYDLARKYNTALIDMYAAWNKDYTTMQTRGLFGTATEDFTGGSGSNTAHPGDKGHRYMSSIVERHL
jgi:lysophospholipase L1-like esterase